MHGNKHHDKSDVYQYLEEMCKNDALNRLEIAKEQG